MPKLTGSNQKNIGDIIKKIHLPVSLSHKGQNGKLMIIGGSKLFHSASLWALEVASRFVDLVHFASIEENNRIAKSLKKEFRNGMVIPRINIEDYIKEDDCVLIGPGLVRAQMDIRELRKMKNNKLSLSFILKIKDEGVQTYLITSYLLKKYPEKKWVLDAGALQMLEVDEIPKGAVLTPHLREWERLKEMSKSSFPKSWDKDLDLSKQLELFSQKFQCSILLKGETDIISGSEGIFLIKGGNAGMTKGGTGDVLAGLLAALNCKNQALTAMLVSSYVNKLAGEQLFKTMGYFFNASDLAKQIPIAVNGLLGN